MDLLAGISIRLTVALAVLVNPYLLVRLFLSQTDLPHTLAFTGITTVGLNMIALLAFHVFGLEITALNLGILHLILAFVLMVAFACRQVRIMPRTGPEDTAVLFLVAAFALCVLPFTSLAGIDTYQWQDLASSVVVEKRVPWVIHPLSLLGFTPRSYPPAQPLLLAAVQILACPARGGTGVDWGFYVVSIVSGMIGILSAYFLGRRVFLTRSLGAWCAFFYAFSPVFLRHNHWATGRGLLVSFMPLLVLAVVEFPKPKAVISSLFMVLLLALTHKAGLGVSAVVVLTLGVSLALRSPRRRLFAFCLLAVSLVLSVLAGPQPGECLFGFVRSSGARFAWMLPFSLIGVFAFAGDTDKAPWRRVFSGLIVALPLAYADMGGALIALIFLTTTATAGFAWLTASYRRHASFIRLALVALTLIPAAAIILHRSVTATPRSLREAARFLENHDPAGPFVVSAPARTTTQIQAYVSGSPRFVFKTTGPRLKVKLKPLPALRGNPKRLFHEWLAFMRQPFSFPNLQVSWYGDSPRNYYVTVKGQGTVPLEGVRLYSADNVTVYGSSGLSRRQATGVSQP